MLITQKGVVGLAWAVSAYKQPHHQITNSNIKHVQARTTIASKKESLDSPSTSMQQKLHRCSRAAQAPALQFNWGIASSQSQVDAKAHCLAAVQVSTICVVYHTLTTPIRASDRMYTVAAMGSASNERRSTAR